VAGKLGFTCVAEELRACDVFIVTVPTPVDRHKRPDLGFLLAASEAVGKLLKPGAVVIYESTVYPGAPEEDCVPVPERHSGLVFNVDFFVGYSPERINPGDVQHRITTVKPDAACRSSAPASLSWVSPTRRTAPMRAIAVSSTSSTNCAATTPRWMGGSDNGCQRALTRR